MRMLADVGYAEPLKVALDTVAMAVAGETVTDYMTAFGDDVSTPTLSTGNPPATSPGATARYRWRPI